MRYYRRRRMRRIALPLVILGSAAAIGGLVGAAPVMLAKPASAIERYQDSLTGCTVTDGDTIRCSGERIRLLGIDAPELPGHCQRGRVCAPGDPYASSRSLGEASAGELSIDRVGEDRYGRTLARVAGPKGDLSCWQLKHGQAIYVPDWDNGLRIARTCPSSTMGN
nr:thermonuclease family protein [Sphingomonas baiyangensis]